MSTITSSFSGTALDESGIPDIIHTRLRSKGPPHSAASASLSTSASPTQKQKPVLPNVDEELDKEAFMFYIVREFLSLHGADPALANLFEQEQHRVKVLDEKSAKKMFQRVTGQQDAVNTDPLLEQLLVIWDEATHKRSCERRVAASPPPSPSSRRSSGSRQPETTTTSATTTGGSESSKKGSSSTRKKKPTLNVITAAEEPECLDTSDATEGDFNRLNHPGSTPKPQLQTLPSPVATSILGEPGSTPKARTGELKALGFDEEELRSSVPVENISSTVLTNASAASMTAREHTELSDDSDISDYAKRKRVAQKHSKRVWLGEPGSTPTKEYIFFRETPPSFVTESVDAAIEVLARLGLDPAFRLQASTPQERFVELQSSEVSKYRVGQEVSNLGAQRNVSGVVAKVFGSRQCGTSGPGTIVIDTCPDASSDSNTQVPAVGVSSAPTVQTWARPATPATLKSSPSFHPDDDDVMDELTVQ